MESIVGSSQQGRQHGGEAATLNPEYIRVSRIPFIYGISRTHIFARIADGTLQSVHVKSPGATRGFRLVKVESLRNYIGSFAR